MDNRFSGKTILKGTAIVSSLTFVSRLTGLLREIVFAAFIGAGFAADAFFVAFRIPNLLRSLVAEGALTSAFVPVFASEFKDGKEKAQATLNSVMTVLLFITLVISALGMLFSPELVHVFAPGFTEQVGKGELCAELLQIMFPYIMFISLIAMLNGALNTVKVFGTSPIAQIVVNLTITAGAALTTILGEAEDSIRIVAFSVLIGGILQILSVYPFLRKAGFYLRLSKHIITPATKQIMKLVIPAIFGAAVYQVNILINTMLASLLQEGSVSWLAYADRLSQLPIGVFTVALSSVLLPALASHAADKSESAFGETLTKSLGYTGFVIIPVSAALFFYAPEIVSVIFQRGAFTPEAVAGTAFTVQAMCFGLWGYSSSSLIMKAFIARKDTLTPALLGLIALALNFTLALLLMGPVENKGSFFGATISSLQDILYSIFPSANFGTAGLALASGLAVSSLLLFSIPLLKQKNVTLDTHFFLSSIFKALLAASAMIAVLSLLPESESRLLTICYGAIPAILVYFGVSFLLKSKEAVEICSLTAKALKMRKK